MAIKLQPLPFSLGALEPHISAATLELHHGQHEAGYVERVNRLVAETPLAHASLDEIVATARTQENRPLYNSAAQAWNHAFFWGSLSPRGGARPDGAVAELIDRDFGRYELFVDKLQQAATNHFGSGWAWVVLQTGRLEVIATSNADLPAAGQTPLLVIDVWEHAYYLDYQHRRGAYVAGVIERLLNWEMANQRLLGASDHVRAPSAAPSAPAQARSVF